MTRAENDGGTGISIAGISIAGISIDGRRIGPGQRPFIVAELSGNHNGDLGRALALVDAAHAAGADAVKLQTYTADTLTIHCDTPHFRIERGPWPGSASTTSMPRRIRPGSGTRRYSSAPARWA